jgi:ATP synthase protein I
MNDKDKRELFAAFGLASAIGFQLAGAIVAGLLLGHFIDQYVKIAPWATIIGLLMGIFTGAFSVYKKIVGNKKV